ncbi:MAG: pyridoxal phosphate-dependent aminotransferase family protein [Pricia sp.]
MTRFPKKLKDKLIHRKSQNTLRHLPEANALVDFSSNDYLGLSRNKAVFQRASQLWAARGISRNGATGSRLLSGNHGLYAQLEKKLSEFHQTESALVFNSGYDANIGFFGSVPQRGDIVFYDELIHASIRDGIKIGNAKSYKFKHNDIADLKKKCSALAFGQKVGNRNVADKSGVSAVEVPVSSLPTAKEGATEIYIITESVFSMDGDSPDLKAFVDFCKKNNYHLVVDEAHAVGVFGSRGEGLVQELELQNAVFARIITFGKAMGCHGAAILGSQNLTTYLVNFARSFIYTTGLPPHSIATILAAYEWLSTPEDRGNQTGKHPILKLTDAIEIFNGKLKNGLTSHFIPSISAIHCCLLPGNERVRAVSEKLRKNGSDVKAILSPTVPRGHERLRICLHSFNTEKEIHELLDGLSNYIENE